MTMPATAFSATDLIDCVQYRFSGWLILNEAYQSAIQID
jgi:hypothetical protein